jgi:hypothetical protein
MKRNIKIGMKNCRVFGLIKLNERKLKNWLTTVEPGLPSHCFSSV